MILAEPVVPVRSRPRWIVPLAIVTVVLLVAGGVGAVVVRGDGRTTVPASELPGAQTITVSPQGAPTDLEGTAGEIAAALPALMKFVESTRGLTFKEPVDVTLLGDAAFRARLTELQAENEPDPEEVENDERVLRALGLLDAGVELDDAIESLLSDAVAGFYEPEANALVVRGDRFSPYVKVTFVHELVHALQDQHFDLHRPELDDRDDESNQSFSALVEGDAKRVESMYVDSLSDAEQKAVQDEELQAASGIDPTIPRILLEILVFPYVAGPPLATALAEGGGQERLDAAFSDPPTTSEQVLHPDLYLADGEPPRDVEPPDAEAEVIDEGVFGELGLILVFRRFLDPQPAFAAAAGWGGDRYVAWRDGDGACVRANLVMDTARDATELREALQAVAGERQGFDVDVTPQMVTFTSCG